VKEVRLFYRKSIREKRKLWAIKTKMTRIEQLYIHMVYLKAGMAYFVFMSANAVLCGN